MTKQLNSLDSLTFSQSVAYNYNERGWLLGSAAPLFQMQLQYNNVNNITGITPTAQYNGNIASQSWGTGSAPNANSYSYAYDQLNRLTSGNGTTGNSENSITYDLMGNITQLYRYQTTSNTLIDQLAYTYTNAAGNYTNQLQYVNNNSIYGSITDLVSGTTNYTYDNNGNILSGINTTTATQNKSYTYNMLNLPVTITIPTGTVTYTYDANGRNLRKVDVTTGGTTKTTDYIDGIEYDSSNTTIGFIQTEEGKIVPSSTTNNYMSYDYYLGDNLGNTRVTFDTKNGLITPLQTDDYYPFGLEINSLVNSTKNEYLYNKKELQEELGQYDYSARFYDPVIGRWNVVDKKAEDPTQISLSPYAYVGNNPVNKTDPDGNCPSCIFAVALEAAGVEEGATLGAATPAAVVTVTIGGLVAIGDFFIQSHHNSYHVKSESTPQSTPDKEKSPPNPNGAKGNIDHQEKVGQLADKAKAEAKPGEKVITEKKIQVPGSNRRPDVQVVDENGKTVKVHEAERKPNSARNKKREAE